MAIGSWCSHAPILYLISEGKVGKGVSDSIPATTEGFMRTVTDSENSYFQKPSETIFFSSYIDNKSKKSSNVGFHIKF